jgi:chitinase
MRTSCGRILLILAAALALSTPVGSATAAEKPRLIGYFAGWNAMRTPKFVAKNVDVSGSAAKLTHINYAFANVGTDLRCAIGDPNVDYQLAFVAEDSVDGVADSTADGVLRGNFNQLRKLKAKYPHLKLLISVGGWSWSDRFSDASVSAESRAAFVTSCVDMFVKGHLAPGIEAPGLFDGIDIDWEYPGACGAKCAFRPEDTANFTALMIEFRRQLDALTRETRRPYLLTIASPGGQKQFTKMELGKLAETLDFINVMTYDYHGASDKVTNFHSPLLASSKDPSASDGRWSDFTIRAYLAAGVPPNKLVLGVPFYGRGWSDVAPGPDGDGLYQAAGAGVTGGSGNGAFRRLQTLPASYRRYRHPEARTLWLYNPDERVFWSYDDEQVMTAKMRYVRELALGGAMFWEMSGDDDTGTLVTTMHDALTASSAAPPAQAAAPAAAEWQSLFDGKTLGKWKPTVFGGEGGVSVVDGEIILETGNDLTGITWTGDVPKMPYEIELKARRLAGGDFFCGLTFPVGSTHCSFIVGGWAGAVVGLSSIDGADASENETTKIRNFEDKRWYTVRVRVTADRMQTWIDDELFADVKTTGRRISIRPEVDDSRPLGIASWRTKAGLKDIRVRSLPQ